MKKALCVTFEAPNKYYGGGKGVIQSLLSLTSNAIVDYLGPHFDKKEYHYLNIHNCYFLEKSSYFQVLNLINGVTIKYYQSWKKYQSEINLEDYDFVYVDFSFNDFVVKWAKEHGKQVIVRVHNIEQDICQSIIKGKTKDKYWIKSIINHRRITHRERYVMHNADKLIFLSNTDRNRAADLYGKEIEKRAAVLPVCIPKEPVDLKPFECGRFFLVTGALDMGANAEGISWFITQVWPKICNTKECEDVSLVVAGRHPHRAIIHVVESSKRVILIDTPDRMEPYLLGADLFIAPIFHGAGMKVKVAEALSFGLTVIGSNNALIGYEEAGEFCVEANSSDEFIEAILNHCADSTNNKNACVEVFNKHFNMRRSITDIGRIINSL